MSVLDYTVKIKSICDSLGSINVNVDEDEMVQVCLGGLAQRFSPLRMAIMVRGNPDSFFNLQSLLLIEENHIQIKSKTSEGKIFFSKLGWWPKTRSRRKRSIRPIPRRELKPCGKIGLHEE